MKKHIKDYIDFLTIPAEDVSQEAYDKAYDDLYLPLGISAHRLRWSLKHHLREELYEKVK
jgi:hypothetical protein